MSQDRRAISAHCQIFRAADADRQMDMVVSLFKLYAELRAAFIRKSVEQRLQRGGAVLSRVREALQSGASDALLRQGAG